MRNYSLCLKLHALCKTTHCVLCNFTLLSTISNRILLSGLAFAFIVKKFPSVKTFYTSTATDASDKYEVCMTLTKINLVIILAAFLLSHNCTDRGESFNCKSFYFVWFKDNITAHFLYFKMDSIKIWINGEEDTKTKFKCKTWFFSMQTIQI